LIRRHEQRYWTILRLQKIMKKPENY